MVAAALRQITGEVRVGGARFRRTGVAGRAGIQPHCGIHRLGHPAAFGRAETRSARESDRCFKEGNAVVMLPSLKRSEEHTSELQSHLNLVCRLLLEKKKIST